MIDAFFGARCPWYVAGPLLGLCVIALRAAVNKPFGALGGYIDVIEHAGAPTRLGLRAYMLAGLVLGGALFSTVTRQAPTIVYTNGFLASLSPAAASFVLVLAGVAIGFGARTGGGCTSGHGISGMSIGSPASFVAAVTFFTTAVAVTHLVSWIIGGSR